MHALGLLAALPGNSAFSPAQVCFLSLIPLAWLAAKHFGGDDERSDAEKRSDRWRFLFGLATWVVVAVVALFDRFG